MQILRGHARVAGGMCRGVEGLVVEPEAVQGATEGAALVGAQQPAVLVVLVPVFGWVDVLPARCDAADAHDVLDEWDGQWYGAPHVGALARVLRDELDGVFQGAVLGFGGLLEVDDLAPLVRVVHRAAGGTEG